MRTRTNLAVVLCTLLLSITSLAIANPVEVTSVTPTESVEARNERLTQRLEEIKAMDIENMSRSEKRALRKEVKHIEKTMANGVYLSVGALIIIILLLILLL